MGRFATHDNTAAKVLRRLIHGLGHTLAQPFGPPAEYWEECACERADKNDEDRGDPEASVGAVATASTTVDVVVVASKEAGVVAHAG